MSVPVEIRRVAGSATPPGPAFWPGVLSGRAFRSDPMEVLRENAQRYGDLVYFRGFEGPIYQFNHPELIQEVMVEHERQNRRALVMQRARGLLGDGLLTSEEPLHMRQRRMMAPAFHRARLTAYGDVIGQYAAEVTGRWAEGRMDVHPQMLLLALRIVGKCMFNLEDESEAKAMAAAVSAFMVRPPPGWVPGWVLERLQGMRFGPMLRVQKGVERLDGMLYGMIAERRKNPGDRGDLLSMLVEADDAEAGEDGVRVEEAGLSAAASPSVEMTRRGMSDKQVRDECLTVLLAGHETTANALSFALWLLATHPEVQEEGHAEAERVLGARVAGAAEYAELTFCWAIFAEAMRLVPTVWVLGRSAGPEAYAVGGYRIEPGAMLLAPQSVVHRDARFWADPERFWPERFVGEGRSARPKFAYFPFGGGARQCIGEGLAWMEGVLVLATILRGWRLRRGAEDGAELAMTASVNLRPTAGVWLEMERR